MSRKRVVVAGLGDVGILAAMRLAKHFDVVGISVKPGLVSGQELGVRLARPRDWARDYWISFDRFRRLDRVRIIQGALTGVDLAERTCPAAAATARHSPRATTRWSSRPASATASGADRPCSRPADVGAGLHADHDRLATAASVIVVGGGAAAVTSAVNLATTWPDKQIDLYFPGRSGAGRLPPADLAANPAPSDRSRGRPAPGPPRRACQRLRGRRDHQRRRRLEHRTTGGLGRRGALGDRTGATQYRLAAA